MVNGSPSPGEGLMNLCYYGAQGGTSDTFTCMFDDYLWKSYVYRTTFSNVKYQDLCATINPSKIKNVRKYSIAIDCDISNGSGIRQSRMLPVGSKKLVIS